MPRVLKDDLKIDIDNLVKNWVDQPKIYFYWSSQLTTARQAAEEARREIDVTYAELGRAIRQSPDEYDLVKVTEDAVKSCITEQKEYKAAVKAHSDANYDVGILTGAVEALQHRKRGLESLVKLHGQQYFASPTAPEGSGSVMEDVVKKSVLSRGRRRQEAEEDEDDD